MQTIRKAKERGGFDFGWLDTKHTFSFGEYQDRDHMGFRTLRVINEDWVQPGTGFGTHGHRDMEIISYVVSGQVQHRDSQGHSEVLSAGEFQAMSAGTGIEHSEWNPSGNEAFHLYQIWIRPDRKGHTPRYRDWAPEGTLAPGEARLVVSPDGGNGALTIHQDAYLHQVMVSRRNPFSYTLDQDRHVWVQAVSGEGTVNGTPVNAGDGVAVSDETLVTLESEEDFEALLFDLG